MRTHADEEYLAYLVGIVILGQLIHADLVGEQQAAMHRLGNTLAHYENRTGECVRCAWSLPWSA